jgi:calcium-dependent protein kinase
LYQDKINYYLVTELCKGGELFDKIVEAESFNEKMACIYIKQVLSAINYCHKKKVMHRDLKPENILITEGTESNHIKIADFGACTLCGLSALTKQAGTAFYIAPEVINKKYNEKADIWSIGVILYIMLCGKPPFEGSNEEEIFKNILIGKAPIDEIKNITENCKDFLKKLLTYKPESRPSASQALEHCWMTEFSKEMLQYSISARLPLERLKKFNVLL